MLGSKAAIKLREVISKFDSSIKKDISELLYLVDKTCNIIENKKKMQRIKIDQNINNKIMNIRDEEAFPLNNLKSSYVEKFNYIKYQSKIKKLNSSTITLNERYNLWDMIKTHKEIQCGMFFEHDNLLDKNIYPCENLPALINKINTPISNEDLYSFLDYIKEVKREKPISNIIKSKLQKIEKLIMLNHELFEVIIYNNFECENSINYINEFLLNRLEWNFFFIRFKDSVEFAKKIQKVDDIENDIEKYLRPIILKIIHNIKRYKDNQSEALKENEELVNSITHLYWDKFKYYNSPNLMRKIGCSIKNQLSPKNVLDYLKKLSNDQSYLFKFILDLQIMLIERDKRESIIIIIENFGIKTAIEFLLFYLNFFNQQNIIDPVKNVAHFFISLLYYFFNLVDDKDITLEILKLFCKYMSNENFQYKEFVLSNGGLLLIKENHLKNENFLFFLQLMQKTNFNNEQKIEFSDYLTDIIKNLNNLTNESIEQTKDFIIEFILNLYEISQSETQTANWDVNNKILGEVIKKSKECGLLNWNILLKRKGYNNYKIFSEYVFDIIENLNFNSNQNIFKEFIIEYIFDIKITKNIFKDNTSNKKQQPKVLIVLNLFFAIKLQLAIIKKKYPKEKNDFFNSVYNSILDLLSKKEININMLKMKYFPSYNKLLEDIEKCKQGVNQINLKIQKFIEIINETKIIFTSELFKEVSIESDPWNPNHNIIDPKRDLLLSSLSYHFYDYYYQNDLFKKLIKKFTYKFKLNTETRVLNYPSKIRNFSNGIEQPLFLKPDKSFFTNNYFNFTHSYFSKEVEYAIKNNKIDELLLYKKPHNIKNLISNSFKCELIRPENVLEGELYFYINSIRFISIEHKYPEKKTFIFSSLKEDIEYIKKDIIIYFKEIKEICSKRFIFLEQAAEILLKDGKSYFFNFYFESFYIQFISLLRPLIKNNQYDFNLIDNPKKTFNDMNLSKKWSDKKIDTYNYILMLNKYSSRSFNDLNQYYIFPWVEKNIDNSTFNQNKHPQENGKEEDSDDSETDINIDIYDESLTKNETPSKSRRNFKYPMGVQEKTERERQSKSYDFRKGDNIDQYQLGSHYSTSSIILYYLIRQNPFTKNLIKLQGEALENPNRLFNSLQTLSAIVKRQIDNRELIPQFYGQIEFMLNLNCNYYGITSSKEIVDDVILSNNNNNTNSEISGLISFIYNHRKRLNDDKIGRFIIKWFEFIFGFNQQPMETDTKAIHRFPELTYEDKGLAKLLKNKINKRKEIQSEEEFTNIREIQNTKEMIINFGQSPSVIINGPHPILKKDDDKSNLGKPIYSLFGLFKPKQKKTLADFVYINKEIEIDKLTSCKRSSFYFKVFLSDSKEVKLYTFSGIKKVKENRDYIKNIYEEEYKAILFSESYFIFIDSNDGMIIIADIIIAKEVQYYYLYYDDFANCIAKYEKDTFFAGFKNGKLSKFKIIRNKNKVEVNEQTNIFAHQGEVKVITIDKKLNLIITAGEDNCIYIRKAYNFELLTKIEIDYLIYEIQDVKLNAYNFVIVLCKERNSFHKRFMGYTLNGIKYAQSSDYDNYCFLKMTHDSCFISNEKNRISIFNSKFLNSSSEFFMNKIFIVNQTAVECYIDGCSTTLYYSGYLENQRIIRYIRIPPTTEY